MLPKSSHFLVSNTAVLGWAFMILADFRCVIDLTSVANDNVDLGCCGHWLFVFGSSLLSLLEAAAFLGSWDDIRAVAL